MEPAEHLSGRTAWKCQCDCGTIKIIKTEELRSGDTKSCGCWNKEQRSIRAKNMYSVNVKYHPKEATARRIHKNRYPEMAFEYFYELSQQICYYCGNEPNNRQNAHLSDPKSSSFAKENGEFIYNGIDRLNNDKDHSDKNNCVPCCKWCNFSKRERTVSEFYAWLKQAYEFQNKNNIKLI